MTISFSNSIQKYRHKTFLVPNLLFFSLCTRLCIFKNVRLLISNMAISFSNGSPKNPNKLFSFVWNFLYWPIWGFLFQIWQWFFKLHPKKYPKKTFSPRFKVFSFTKTVFILKNMNVEGLLKVLIPYLAINFFNFQLKKNKERHFWFQNLIFFYLHHILHVDKMKAAHCRCENTCPKC